jgi:hypothetical protein
VKLLNEPIKTTRLTVVDDQGRDRMRAYVKNDYAVLEMMNASGSGGLEIAVGDPQTTIGVQDDQGETRLAITIERGQAHLDLRGEGGVTVVARRQGGATVSLSIEHGEPVVTVIDREGVLRSVVTD